MRLIATDVKMNGNIDDFGSRLWEELRVIDDGKVLDDEFTTSYNITQSKADDFEGDLLLDYL